MDVLGRRIRFPRAAGGLLRASFASLCGQALGPQDYLAIAARFHTCSWRARRGWGPRGATRRGASSG
ncbi:MAG: AFG1/ZapE family ATPase [Caulobacteraceae bacterium]